MMSTKLAVRGLTLALACAAALAQAQSLTVTNARILDGNGKVIERGSVVVRDGKIVSVAAGAPTAAAGRVIDGTIASIDFDNFSRRFFFFFLFVCSDIDLQWLQLLTGLHYVLATAILVQDIYCNLHVRHGVHLHQAVLSAEVILSFRV
jgi:hypothetical protein